MRRSAHICLHFPLREKEKRGKTEKCKENCRHIPPFSAERKRKQTTKCKEKCLYPLTWSRERGGEWGGKLDFAPARKQTNKHTHKQIKKETNKMHLEDWA